MDFMLESAAVRMRDGQGTSVSIKPLQRDPRPSRCPLGGGA
jgi:hypothetical protein